MSKNFEKFHKHKNCIPHDEFLEDCVRKSTDKHRDSKVLMELFMENEIEVLPQKSGWHIGKIEVLELIDYAFDNLPPEKERFYQQKIDETRRATALAVLKNQD